MEELVREPGGFRGRRRESRKVLARVFVTKAVYNFKSTRELMEALKTTPNLRRSCGYEKKSDIPHESTFSLAFEDVVVSELSQRLHAALIEKHRKEVVVGHISLDRTAIEGREKSVAKPTLEKVKSGSRKRVRPRRREKCPPKEHTVLEH